ncbi:MAG: hypothetical protein Q4B40_04875 [Clostridia bacterium]|nr:hypothetical protein [Clostridia bacterium]
MQRCKRLLSVILILIILAASNIITVSATGQTAQITGDGVALRTKPSTASDSTVIRRLNCNDTVTVNSQTTGQSITAEGQTSNIWYNVTYGSDTGYVSGIYVYFPPTYEYDPDFEKNLKNFPESYHSSLRALHAKYPNWQFVAHNVNISFKEAVEAQYGVNDVTKTRKWVEINWKGDEWRDPRAYNKTTGKWITLESRWTYASRAAIENYMDPRNSLTEGSIFAFMQQSYDSATQTKAVLKNVVAGTFLANGYDGNADAYLDDIMEAAKQSKVNPYVLAATIIIEQGVNGTSSLISGKYAGYEGYYNFFNFGAYGTNVVKAGLEYAKAQGWNSRRNAIVGGAKKYADGYISVGQDTYYYKDFNVVNKNWNNQYASALYDAWTNASRLKKGCMTNPNAAYIFKIPVYTDMPSEPCPVPTLATWKKGSQGWWYDFGNGSYAIGWEKINDKWYYFDASGWMQTEWEKINNKWYYLGLDGAMRIGWQKINDKWYYLDSSGAMQTDWQKIKDKWYYFDSNGVMLTSWQQIDGARYYFNANGVMLTGLQQIDNAQYYFNASGAMQTGWQKINGKKYYFDTSGIMATLWQQIDGVRYYFDKNGALHTGWLQFENYWYYLDADGKMQTGWQKIGGKKYYFDTNGVMATSWQQIDGERYYFDADGVYQIGWLYLGKTWYYFDVNGVMKTNWQKINQKWYYFNQNGAMLTSWQQIDGVWYYLNSNGVMQTGWQKLGKTWYYFNQSGAMLTEWQKINQKWYYFNDDGAMLTGWQQIDDVWYYFNSSGAMLTGTQTIGGKIYKFDSSGAWIE